MTATNVPRFISKIMFRAEVLAKFRLPAASDVSSWLCYLARGLLPPLPQIPLVRPVGQANGIPKGSRSWGTSG
jgi:hypothetical protein